jgi:hypothetical protein
MKDLSVIYGNSRIRITDDKRVSVLDLITANGYKKPKDAWAKLQNDHPKLSSKMDHFQFKGQGQRLTPVAKKEVVLQLLMVLHGDNADQFREWAATELIERLEEEKRPELAVDRAFRLWGKQGKSADWIQARIESIHTRNTLTSILKQHGIIDGRSFSLCTNGTYVGLFGRPASELKERAGLKPADSLRNTLSDFDLTQLKLAEMMAANGIAAKRTWGDQECAAECHRAAKAVSDAVRGFSKGA